MYGEHQTLMSPYVDPDGIDKAIHLTYHPQQRERETRRQGDKEM
jgi:hypothetical protein